MPYSNKQNPTVKRIRRKRQPLQTLPRTPRRKSPLVEVVVVEEVEVATTPNPRPPIQGMVDAPDANRTTNALGTLMVPKAVGCSTQMAPRKLTMTTATIATVNFVIMI